MKSRFSILPEGEKTYRKVPKFLEARTLCCNLPKTQTKRPNLRVFRQKEANRIANREDPDQTALLGFIGAASRENLLFAYAKTKAQISCTLTVQLTNVFGFAS